MTTTADHIWASRVDTRRVFCVRCNVIRRADGANKPCQGVVGISVNTAQASAESKSSIGDLRFSDMVLGFSQSSEAKLRRRIAAHHKKQRQAALYANTPSSPETRQQRRAVARARTRKATP